MQIENDKNSAFPRPISSYVDAEFGTRREYLMNPASGLSKREYYASQIACGICSSRECGELVRYDPNWIAKQAVEIADALIAELNKEIE